MPVQASRVKLHVKVNFEMNGINMALGDEGWV